MTGTSWGRWNAALVAAALAAGLAGCGGSSSSSSATSAAPAASSATASATTTAASATTPASGGATVAPGTKLAIGQSAKVAYTPAGATGTSKSSTLMVAVKSLEKGTLADFNGIQLDASQKAGTPNYVKVHVSNLGPHPIDVDGTAAAIQGVDSTGSNQQSVTFIGDFPRCPDTASTAPMAPGKSYDTCLTFLVPGGIGKVSYNGNDAYINSPVIWSPR